MKYSNTKDSTRTYGNKRSEIIGAMGSIFIIWVLTFWIFIEATERAYKIYRGDFVYLNSKVMVYLSISSLLMNITMILILNW